MTPASSAREDTQQMVSAFDRHSLSHSAFTVVWTRGEGCAELAGLLDGAIPSRVQGEIRDECVAARADLLVTRRLHTGFDFVNVAVPHGFESERVEAVSAAVSGGPHSALAARVALQLGRSLSVPAEMVSAYRTAEDQPAAQAIVDGLSDSIPDLSYRVIRTSGAAELIESLPAQTLLVLGAPGGTWLQRAFFGPGVRLRQRAPAGAIVVQQAPPRVYHRLGEPVYVSRHLHVADALEMMEYAAAAVLDEGKLVGVVTRRALRVPDDAWTNVGDVMDEPIYLEVGDPLEEASQVEGWPERVPIPVVDDEMRLVGCVRDPQLEE